MTLLERQQDFAVEMRRIQYKHGRKITPRMSVLFGQMVDRSMQIEPEGHGLKTVAQAIRELLAD